MINLQQQTLNDKGVPAVYQQEVQKEKIDEVTKETTTITTLEETPVTVYRLLRTALLTNAIRLRPRGQAKRYELFQRINDDQYVSFNWCEKHLLKKLVAKTYDVIVYGQISDILKQDTK